MRRSLRVLKKYSTLIALDSSECSNFKNFKILDTFGKYVDDTRSISTSPEPLKHTPLLETSTPAAGHAPTETIFFPPARAFNLAHHAAGLRGEKR